MKRGTRVEVVEDDRLTNHFAKSGLSKSALKVLRIVLVRGGTEPKIRASVDFARIPYFDAEGRPSGAFRARLLAPFGDPQTGKLIRYMSPPGASPELYLPPLNDRPFEAIFDDVTTPLVIAEGEKKAAAGCLNGIPTIGIAGVWNWRSGGRPIAQLLEVNWLGRDAYICFDSPDLQANEQVAHAADALANHLRALGARVRFIILPTGDDGAKVGLDDYLMQAGEGAYRRLLDSAVDYFDAISEMNSQYLVVQNGAAGMVLHEKRVGGRLQIVMARPNEIAPVFANRFYTPPPPADAKPDEKPKPVNLFKGWMASSRRRQAKAVGFEPGLIDPDIYNTWRSNSIQAVPGDCSLFLAHVRENLAQGDLVVEKYIHDWAAHMIQKPRELPGTALVLMGGQGTGKTMFADILGALVGDSYLAVSSSLHLTGQFNAQLANKLLVLADEATWAGDKAAEGVLKAMITSKTRLVEGKGKDPYEVNNYLRLIVASNNDWPVPAGVDERRMAVIAVGKGSQQDTEFFGKLHRQMYEEGGIQALLRFLQTRDISNFRPQAIPRTDALLKLKMRSWSEARRFWYECLSQGTNCLGGRGWATELSTDDLHDAYIDHATKVGSRRRLSKAELGAELSKLVPTLETKRIRKNLAKQTLFYLMPSLPACRQHFEDVLNQPMDWHPDDEAPSVESRASRATSKKQ